MGGRRCLGDFTRPSKRPRTIKGSVNQRADKMALSRNPSAARDRCCHPPPLLKKLTSQDASQLKALFPWQAPYSPSCSLIYELSAGGSRHQRLSPCTTKPHVLYRSVGLSGANRRLLSRHRWLAMDHSQCHVPLGHTGKHAR